MLALQPLDRMLQADRPYEGLVRAYDEAGEHDLALATYGKYLTTPWLWRYENDAIAGGQILRRVGEHHELRGENRDARRVYDDLLKLWGRAEAAVARDANEIRTRVARLTVGPSG